PGGGGGRGANPRRQNPQIRSRCNPPKKGRDSSHQAAVPCDNCGKRSLASQTYFSMYARTTGASPGGSSSSTGGSLVPTNWAKKRRSERSWWTRMVRIEFVFSCGLKSSKLSGTARHTLTALFVSLA